jgi:hypothetical protein
MHCCEIQSVHSVVDDPFLVACDSVLLRDCFQNFKGLLYLYLPGQAARQFFMDCFNLEDEGTMILGKVGNQTPNNRRSHLSLYNATNSPNC